MNSIKELNLRSEGWGGGDIYLKFKYCQKMEYRIT